MASSSRTKATPDRIGIAQREAQALDLRKAGATYRLIAERVGYENASGAYKAVQRALEHTIQEPAGELREIERERLDQLLVAIWPQAMQGKWLAVDRCLAIMERRAKLLGLDAPAQLQVEQQAVTVTLDVSDPDTRELIGDLLRRRPALRAA